MVQYVQSLLGYKFESLEESSLDQLIEVNNNVTNDFINLIRYTKHNFKQHNETVGLQYWDHQQRPS